MRNLIPESRTDKNGITSTRWVKPDLSPNLVSAAIPMPIASMEKPIDLTYEVLVIRGLLQAKNDTVHTDRMIGDNLRYIAERDTGLLNQIKIVASENEPASFIVRNLIKKDGFYEVNSPVSVRDPHFNPEEAMQDIGTALHLIPLCSRLEARLGFDEFELGTEGHMLIQSVTRTLKRENVTGLSAERTLALAMVAYVRDTIDFGEGDDEISYIEIENEIDYIVGHLDEVESLLPELHARKAYDQETIESLLNAPAQAIRNGLL
jgi:hypothetical protein